MQHFDGLVVCNVELSSRCDKVPGCWMCGRRKLEKEYPELCNWGDMDFKLVEKISEQLPSNIIIQFHANGESLLYPEFGAAVRLFKNQIKCLDTNGKLLLEKADEVINVLDTLTISVIQDDPEGDEQYEIVKRFLDIKKDRKPFMVYRLLGDVENKDRWYNLQGVVATRVLHDPYGSFNYQKKVTIPEIGICLDLLSHLVIDRNGWTFSCVRFNPYQYNCLGNIRNLSLLEIWNSQLRLDLIKEHIKGDRSGSKLCASCEFYGCPVSY